MKRKIIGILVCTLLIATMYPVVGLIEDNELTVVNNSLDEANEINTIKCNVFDSLNGRLSKHMVSEEDKQRIIELMKDEITQESFPKQIEEKLNVLSDIGLVEPETVTKLSNIFKIKYNYLNKYSPFSNKIQLFEVINIFSGIFFGLKGVKEYAIGELTVININKTEFIIGNMTGGFTIMYKFTGNGSIFSIGFLGIKKIHDYDPSKYEDPYLPIISGYLAGFAGILIEIEAAKEYSLFLGFGMSFATIWSKLN